MGTLDGAGAERTGPLVPGRGPVCSDTTLEAALGHVRPGQGAGGRRACWLTREAVGMSTGSASWAWLQLCPALALKAWGSVFSFLLLLVFFL